MRRCGNYKNQSKNIGSEISVLRKEVLELTRKLDHATDHRNSIDLESLILEAKILSQNNNFDFISQANLFYSIATAYSDLSYFICKTDDEILIEKQIYYFRKSIDLLNENKENCEVSHIPYINGLELALFTNYASTLDRVGRRIEAILYYRKALAINSDFSMALGNMGISYLYYAGLMYDPVLRDFLNFFAYSYLNKSLALNETLTDNALTIFKQYTDQYDTQYIEFLYSELSVPELEFDDEEEGEYKLWVLNHQLFINPLNDLYLNDLYFARDILHLPSMIVKISTTNELHGLFNQLKQEYISARYLLYEATQLIDKPHFADKDTYLVNGDYPLYSIRIEKNKLAFRALYSIFDKVAYFINDYFDLGIEEKDVNFRSIWDEEKKGRRGYRFRNILNHKENLALNAIYWISKDVFKKLYDSPKPRAKELNDIRNGLEHKFVEVYNGLLTQKVNDRINQIGLYISEHKLFDITMEIIWMVREVLINLSLAVHIEEQKRKEKKDEEIGILPNIFADIYSDEWKI